MTPWKVGVVTLVIRSVFDTPLSLSGSSVTVVTIRGRTLIVTVARLLWLTPSEAR